MTRVMRDSTRAADIPIQGTDIVAGYDNGLYKWSATDWARFKCPHAGIDVNGSHPASGILDVEDGDATIPTAVKWVKEKQGTGNFVPIIYTSRSNLTPLFNAMNAAGLHIVKNFKIWVATLDGTKTLHDMTGVVAVQWASARITGHHYDESIVYDDTWHRVVSAPPPVTHPVPPPNSMPPLTEQQKSWLRGIVGKHVEAMEKEIGL